MVRLKRSANDCHENDNLPDCFLFAIGAMLVSFNHDFNHMVLHDHEILQTWENDKITSLLNKSTYFLLKLHFFPNQTLVFCAISKPQSQLIIVFGKAVKNDAALKGASDHWEER